MNICRLDEIHLLRELKAYRKKGIILQLNGRPSTPIRILSAYKLAEARGRYYMRDYIHNERGEVEVLDFDLIREE